ncbi:MAG TPA: sel1 repeat family protein, partial [Gammaproteobacteria bacterium]|nr:sel1 repeat family protein [Gammaproteobacteria bacterium]
MKKRILLSLLCGMLAVGGVFGVTKTGWANEEKNLTLPDGLFENSSNFELRYESGSLDPASLNGSALGVRFYEKGEAFGHAEKVSIVSTGSLAGSDLVVEELIIDGLVLDDKDGDRLAIESHRLTQPQGLTESKNAGISTNGTPKALPPIPDSNVLDWLSARRAYVEEDYETVLRLMVPHAEIGTESAQRIVAHSYRKTNQFEQAATWYQGLAEKGDAASQFYLGMLYQKGFGVEQDNEVALEWLEKAVAQGDARAIHALALSTQTIEVVKGINPGLSARAQEVLTDVVRHYYDADDPAGMHFSGKSDVRIPTALWDRVIARWRAEGVMSSHVILQAVAGEDVGNEPATESA